MSLKERCPGTGAFARDLADNPRASCPVCGKSCRLTKSGCIRLHKRAVRTHANSTHDKKGKSMTDTYIATGTQIEFYDRDAAEEYAAATGECFEVWRDVEVCRASPDFQALSFTTVRVYVDTFAPDGFQF